MKRIFIFLLLLVQFFYSYAQTNSIIHHGSFKKGRILMSSNQYKPDDWEKPYFDSSLKTAFPSDLIKHPDKYLDKLIHLIGVVDSAFMESSENVTFRLENKYWDYTEDYSIQDEKMFVSEKGEGKFLVTLSNISPEQFEDFKRFPEEHKLFLVYGNLKSWLTISRFLLPGKSSILTMNFIQQKYFHTKYKETRTVMWSLIKRVKFN